MINGRICYVAFRSIDNNKFLFFSRILSEKYIKISLYFTLHRSKKP